MSLGKMPFDPTMGAFGQFMLGDGRQEACGGPSFSIGLLGKLRPECFDRRQAELVEHDAEARFVDSVGGLHAASPVQADPIKASYH